MKTSTEGLIALIGHEGIVLTRYKDSVGVWTIGIGHTKAAGGLNPETFTGTLTMQEALDLLRKDIVKYETGVNSEIKVPLEQHEFDALVSFHYNTGAIARASLTKSINAGDKAKAASQFMSWVKPPEIKGRRTAEMNLFKTGKYPAPMATVYPATDDGKVLWGKGTRVNVAQMLEARPINRAQTSNIGQGQVTAAQGPIIKPPAPEDLSFDKDELKAFQQLLKDKGYVEVGKVDGFIGKNTVSAITAFEIAQGRPVTGKLTQELWDALKVAPMRPVSAERANATVPELIKEDVPAVKPASLLRNIGIGLGTLTGLGSIVDGGVPDLDKLTSSINKTQVILGLIGNKLPWLIGMAAAGAAAYYGHKIVRRQLEGFRKGTIR